MKLRDLDIRVALNEHLAQKFQKDKTTILIDEVEICMGYSRADVVVVNGALHGYEIKSDFDKINRFDCQRGYYEQVFDYTNLICGKMFYEKNILNKVELPRFWGISIATIEGNKLKISERQKARKNKNIDIESVVQLLWKDEALSILEKCGASAGYRSKAKRFIYDKLIEVFAEDQNRLRCLIRECLKNRDWRAAVLHK